AVRRIVARGRVGSVIRTERLVLREWADDDREPWAALNADPAVMEFFPSTLDRKQADAAFDRFSSQLAERGWGLWAVALDGRFVGFTGLSVPRFEAPFMPATEIGWRFAREAWGHGYATEAARAVLEHAFSELGLPEVVSFTTVANVRSRAVMERLGMTRDPAEDFDHPSVEPGHPLRRHVLYRARP
ncbi:MAG TPA: GNAT family N-acetyltransferase, partial [Rhodoglobus sp.]|nr:GNAT family N-acetyltransferase [Rhodoglobus sp.]